MNKLVFILMLPFYLFSWCVLNVIWLLLSAIEVIEAAWHFGFGEPWECANWKRTTFADLKEMR